MRFSASSPPIALALITLAMALMPLNDVLIKLMSSDLSLFQIIVLRSVLIMGVLLFFSSTWHSFRGLSLRVWALLLVRGGMIAMAMLIYFVGVTFMDLWQAAALFFVAPLLISLLAVPLLGERIGLWRIAAQIMGFAGVLCIAVPASSGGFNLAFLLPLVAALYYALYSIMTRLMGDEASTLAMTNVQHVGYILVGLMFAGFVWVLPFGAIAEVNVSSQLAFIIRDWRLPSVHHWLFFLVCGVLIGFLSFASANAYGKLEASLVAPFEYIYLPFAILWGLVTGDPWPSTWGWLGMALIFGAGLLTVFRENIRNVEVASTAPMPMAAVGANLEAAVSGEEAEQEVEARHAPV